MSVPIATGLIADLDIAIGTLGATGADECGGDGVFEYLVSIARLN